MALSGGRPFIVGTTNIVIPRQIYTAQRYMALSTHMQDGMWIVDTFESTQRL